MATSGRRAQAGSSASISERRPAWNVQVFIPALRMALRKARIFSWLSVGVSVMNRAASTLFCFLSLKASEVGLNGIFDSEIEGVADEGMTDTYFIKQGHRLAEEGEVFET